MVMRTTLEACSSNLAALIGVMVSAIMVACHLRLRILILLWSIVLLKLLVFAAGADSFSVGLTFRILLFMFSNL